MGVSVNPAVYVCGSIGTFALIVSCVFGYMEHKFGGLIGGFQRWSSPSMWEERPCRVISAGINCMDTGGGGICWGYGRDSALNAQTTPVIFGVEDIAVCPGTYYCASENDWCDCDGTVTFYPQLMDEINYVGIHSAMRVRLSLQKPATDRIRCDLESFGGDPAPGQTKHCWCTPQAVLQELPSQVTGSQVTETMASIEQCAKDSSNEYHHDMAGETSVGRRLQHTANASRRAEFHEVTTDNEDIEAGEAEDDEEEAAEEPLTTSLLSRRSGGVVSTGATERRLKTSDDRRRRRTFVYSPWAYVEVQPSTSLFAKSDGKPEKVCAYQYGATEPASELRELTSDGPVYGYVSDAEQWLRDWQARGSSCWVRNDLGGRGSFGSSSQTCAVSMERPDTLIQKTKAAAEFAGTLCHWGAGFGCLFCLIAGGCVAYSAIQAREVKPDEEYAAMSE